MVGYYFPRKRVGLGKQKPKPEQAQPLPSVAKAFGDHIQNHIPARLIDTTKLTLVDRSAVVDVFFAEITQITEEDRALQAIVRYVVRYAIFSHRWTDSEPNYQDVSASGFGLSKRRNSKTAGLVKLVQLCETARALGYKFVWSDTCCINKTNPAELSEAVRAMFRWYSHAHLCIVHLAASSSLKDFEHEPWLRRGWTLQELLAPRQIKFYDQRWHPFTDLPNDKNDPEFMSVLSRITGIPHNVIVADNSSSIKGRSVSEIMSWSTKRESTRVEDAAYCFYGLFDVFLPIAYGEGEKAFPRLVEAIVDRYRAWDAFVWSGQASERHPALPCSPACYAVWDPAMVSEGAGMTDFTLTPHRLQLTSVPLIPMSFASAERHMDGEQFTMTLRVCSDTATARLGVYGDVTVICGLGRLCHIQNAVDLHARVLNYRQSKRDHWRMLQVGQTYVCFLLFMRGRNKEGSTWLKVATDNVLRITCKGAPASHTSSETEVDEFDLPLQTTYIRAPRVQTTIRT